MTSRELIAAEADNTDRIVLYREGLFWKAYERSAYALCTQVRAFRPTRKVLKTLGGGDIVSVGFPAIAADRILAGLSRLDLSAAAEVVPAADGSVACMADIAASPTRMVFAAPQPIVESDFRAWKSALPISLSIPRPAAADTSSCDETSAAELSLHGRPADASAHAAPSRGDSADALRPASGRAATADLAASADSGAAAGSVAGSADFVAVDADFAARPAQPRLWTRLGDWLVRWATRSASSTQAVSSLQAASSPCAVVGIAAAGAARDTDASPVAADTASPAGTAASAEQVLGALRNFEVADKTPMECMMFIAELKKQLLKI